MPHATSIMEPCDEIVDGVHRYPRTGIRVIVVGAGVGGLMAGLESWRKGHEVQILERSESMSSLGDGFSITPSGLPTLHKYPKMKIAYNEHMYNSTLTFSSYSGFVLHQEDPEWNGCDDTPVGTQQVSFTKSRSEFAKMLLDQAARLGISIYWGRKVTVYEEDVLSGEARVRTESGELFTGDVVIAADGVGTRSHSIVNGGQAKAEPSGFTAARVSFPREAINLNSKAAALLPALNARSNFRIYLTEGEHLILMLQQDWIGIVYTHPDGTIAGPESKGHSKIVTREAMIAALESHGTVDPALVDLIRQIPSTNPIVDWRLSWRDPLPQWVSKGGRIVQLGDSAHSFLPTSGNGATQALEDAVSLPECLRLGGKNKVCWSTSVHQLLRFERVSLIQKFGFEAKKALHHSIGKLEEMYANGALLPSMHLHGQGEWMWKHNAEHYATDNFEPALNHLQNGAEFHNTNIPDGVQYKPWSAKEFDESKHAAKIEVPAAAVAVSVSA